MKLILGDCLERMKEIPDGSVDAIITDPPYKVTSRGGYTSAGGMMLDSTMRKGNVFRENEVTISQWLPILYQKLKESGHCYIMCNNKNLHGFLNAVSQSEFKLVKTMVWAKDNKIMSQAYMSQIEFILFLRKNKFKRINNCGTSDLMSHKNPKRKSHPTEKPVSLMEVLMVNSSAEGEVVFDPFMGTGAVGVACANTNREFVGIEKDEGYFKIAENRIREAKYTQLGLLDTSE